MGVGIQSCAAGHSNERGTFLLEFVTLIVRSREHSKLGRGRDFQVMERYWHHERDRWIACQDTTGQKVRVHFTSSKREEYNIHGGGFFTTCALVQTVICRPFIKLRVCI